MKILTSDCLTSRCFTCASSDYQPLLERFTDFQRSANIARFGEFCDNLEHLVAFAPITECSSTCVTIMEPQYFGGMRYSNTA